MFHSEQDIPADPFFRYNQSFQGRKMVVLNRGSSESPGFSEPVPQGFDENTGFSQLNYKMSFRICIDKNGSTLSYATILLNFQLTSICLRN